MTTFALLILGIGLISLFKVLKGVCLMIEDALKKGSEEKK